MHLKCEKICIVVFIFVLLSDVADDCTFAMRNVEKFIREYRVR